MGPRVFEEISGKSRGVGVFALNTSFLIFIPSCSISIVDIKKEKGIIDAVK